MRKRSPIWVVCATYGYKQNGDHQAYERLVSRYGQPDHPLLRYSRAYLYDDGEALRQYAPEAVASFRSHDEDDAAVHAEIAGVASGSDEHRAFRGARRVRLRLGRPLPQRRARRPCCT